MGNCKDNGHHDLTIDYYDCYEYIGFSATCKICGATAESNEAWFDIEEEE